MANETVPMFSLEHLEMYVRETLSENELTLENYLARYAEAEKKYYKSLWYRIFKTKFEDTFDGDVDNWFSTTLQRRKVAKMHQELNVISYHKKMGNDIVPWILLHLSKEGFYTWANETGIPY